MLNAERSAGIAPEVNLRNPLHAGNKAYGGNHRCFETQGRCHEKSKTGLSVAPQKGLMSSKFFKQETNKKLPVFDYR